MKLTTTIDVALGRGQNMRESWHATAGRKDKEKKATKKALESHTNTNQLVSVLAYFDDLGARITVVRPYSPSAGPMDSDNLSGSFKYPRDEIAAFLGVDDGSPRLHFIYQQTIAVKLGVSVKKGRTKASPDYDTRPTITIEVMPVQDIDPQVKRVRELEAGLRQTMDALIEVQQRHDENGACYCAEWHDKHKPWCLEAKSAIAAARLLLAPRIAGVPLLVDDNQPEVMHMKASQ